MMLIFCGSASAVPFVSSHSPKVHEVNWILALGHSRKDSLTPMEEIGNTFPHILQPHS